jgi:two-component system, OmpR family, heavy metal sensor histidine kinase CusS
MSSKTADKKEGHPRSGSLAALMTLWYALSAFAIVLTASGFLYRALSDGLAHENDILLSQNFQSLTAYMDKSPGDLYDLQQFVGEKPKWYRTTSFWTRLLDGDQILTETPGMSQSLPLRLFPQGSPKVWSSTVHSSEGVPFRVLSTQAVWPGYIHPNVTVQMAIDMGPDEKILKRFRKKLLTILAFSLLACALVGYWIAERGIRPVRKMAKTAARIKSSTLDERLDRSGLPSELSDLALTFNDMLDRLEDSFVRLSRFSSDIAHELRTPLQNLRGEAEVVLSKEREPGEYQNRLGSALEEYQRLSNLIDRLLFLARAENPQTQIQLEPVDLKKELGLLQDFYGPLAGESGIALRVEAPEGLRADLDRSLFQQAVGNLVENAMKYTPAGGTILLKTSAGDGDVRVEVSDTGKGIPPDQLSRVFDRFYRVDPSRASSSGGAGLGLSIVKSIMNLHAGTVEIRSEPSHGTTVALLFPAIGPSPDPG